MKNLFKKILTVCAIIIAASAVFNLSTPQTVSAADSGFKGSCRYLLGLTSWDCGVKIANESDLKNNIWTIVVNIVTDITVIAAYLVLGFVIYGGYLYIFSGGDPNKVTAGKRTLAHAFIGLAIVMSASIIMGAIRIALVGSNGDISKCASTDAGCVNPDTMVINLIQWVVGVAGVVAVIFIVYGGISYIISSGDPNKVKKAKDIILYAIIGLIIVALAEIITAFVSGIIRDANTKALINETTISKEVHETKTN
ncbi:MAG: hypothetical protein Q4F56_02865 [Candidatus Saccharibacteria bacterium]|nr:hypothetical protein [Candidatus Saccharibacteria bacterium]